MKPPIMKMGKSLGFGGLTRINNATTRRMMDAKRNRKNASEGAVKCSIAKRVNTLGKDQKMMVMMAYI